MKIGVPKEIKNRENRVGLTPGGVEKLVQDGHTVLVEKDAGAGSGFTDEDYQASGADIVQASQAWEAELVVKIKEPLESEYPYLGKQILFTYLHLAGVDRTLTETLLSRETSAVAYETVEDDGGRLPLLAPMSAVAGNMALTMGNYYLASFNRGRGMLLGSVLGKKYGSVMVLGDGIVGHHAAKTAAGMGAEVMIFSRKPERAAQIRKEISPDIDFRLSSPDTIAAMIPTADLVVGAVLQAGARAEKIVTEAMVKTMPRGSVIVDVSIDQGGCIETSRPTSHTDPVFEKHGVIHYCVTNMPGAYPRTSTVALTSATLPYIRSLAANGIEALKSDRGFSRGLNTYQGKITCRPVAESLGLENDFRTFY